MRFRCIALAALMCALAGCSGALRWSTDYHVVREGETLFSISRAYNLDARSLAYWNRLGDGKLIYPGQRLRLNGPSLNSPASTARRSLPASERRASSPSRPPPTPVSGWSWPANGPVVAEFGSDPKTESGLHIGGRLGEDVRAAAGGKVVYAGSGLKSYGQLIIIKHNDSFLSAYGHNARLLVTEGASVKSGERIAKMGEGPGQRPLVHFEIRRDGEPVNPTQYLPRR